MRLALIYEPGYWETHNNFYANGVCYHARRGIEKTTLLQDDPDFEEVNEEGEETPIDTELYYKVVE